MPQIDIQYSPDLNLEANQVCQALDDAINTVDGPGRDCQIRLLPAKYTNTTHMLISIGLLEKPHRDKAFREKMVASTFQNLIGLVPTGIIVSINIYWLDNTYQAKVIP